MKRSIHGIEITRGPDGLWRDDQGTVYALVDAAASADPVVRAGVGPLSLPADHWSTDGVRAHDFAFSSPTYQRSHARSEADRMLLDHLLLVAGERPGRRAAAYAFYGLSRAFSWLFWEDRATRRR
ncbi:MAG: hypothetical protein K2X87_30875 [Gemmataceae bacterium]|nr:hypothetical protein [Gemmataceae bacterium]